MSLGRLLRRASSRASDLLTLTPAGSGGPPSVLDGEIIYSKNNVCVHPPEGLQGLGEHHPGEPGRGEGQGHRPGGTAGVSGLGGEAGVPDLGGRLGSQAWEGWAGVPGLGGEGWGHRPGRGGAGVPGLGIWENVWKFLL